MPIIAFSRIKIKCLGRLTCLPVDCYPQLHCEQVRLDTAHHVDLIHIRVKLYISFTCFYLEETFYLPLDIKQLAIYHPNRIEMSHIDI